MKRALALFAAAIAAAHALAYNYYLAGSEVVVWPGAQATRFLSPTTFPARSAPDALYLSGMGQWSDVPGADFQYFYVRNPQDFPVDHFDGFSDTLAVLPSELDPGVLAVTYMVNDGAEWYDMDMLFASVPEGVGWSFDADPDCDLLAAPLPDNGFSFFLVALHELGHGIGLGHDPLGGEPAGTPWIVGTMDPHYPMGGPFGRQNIVELHVDDRNGARFLYPHGGPSNPPVLDLASAGFGQGAISGRAEPIFFDPPAVAPGATLAARSVVENLGTSNHFQVHQGFYLSDDDVIEPDDLLIGEILWDLPFGDGFEFDAIMQMPGDLPAGPYLLGSILDDLGEIAEEYEDNNAALYCDALTVEQLAPVVEALPQQIVVEGEPFAGPVPAVTHPLNMNPITWSLDDAPAGMTIDAQTGAVSWPDPVVSPFLYAVLIRATNGAGTTTVFLFVGVVEPGDCPADCGPGSGDGVVGVSDMLAVFAEWGTAGPFNCDMAPPGGDGVVGVDDFLMVFSEWGPCP